VATWLPLYPQAGGGGGGNLRADDALIAVPDALGIINVYGGEPYLGDGTYINMYTTRPDANTINVCLKRSINQPQTNATATEGMYSLGGMNFMHNYANTALGGAHNTWLGHNSGNLVMSTATDNTGIGYNALRDVDQAMFCTAVGSGALSGVDDGQYCIGIGYNAGANLDVADSDDIMIGNPGVLGDLNTIRIGKMPFPNPLVPPGAGEQNKIYVAGIWNGTDNPAKDNGIVIVDEDGMLYVDNLDNNSIVGTGPTGRCIGLKGPVGTVLTGHGILPGDPAPEFLPLTSGGGTVVISTDPITGSINLEAAGVAGLVQLTADTGPVLPLVGNINVLGGDLINTDNLVANTVTVNLDRSTQDPAVHCEIVTGMGPAGASIYKELWSADGSILFDLVSDPTKISIIAPGGGGGALTNLKDMNDIACLPIAGVIKIDAGDNIETNTTGPGVLEVRVTDNVDLAGWLHAALEVQAGADLISTAGNLSLPLTNEAGTAGTIKFDNHRYMHMYGASASWKNLFIGYRSGNITMTDNVATGNLGVGYATTEYLTTGTNNTGIGYAALNLTTTGDYNTAVGYGALQRNVTGAYNTALGRRAGYNYTGAERSNICIGHVGVLGESNVIRIGTHGTGDGQQYDTYIAGIYGRPDGPSAQMVVCGSNNKISTSSIPASGAISFVTDSGTATVSGTTIQVKGGANINTTGSSNIVTVNLDTSILQPYAATATTSGFYSIGSTSYLVDRFLHAWCYNQTPSTNIYAGYQSGRVSTGAIGFRNVGVGYQSMDAVTTSNTTTSLGYLSHSNLTSGSNNIALGANSGLNYTTEGYNITLGHRGVVADSRTMRLGYDTQWSVPAPDPHNPDPVETRTVRGVDNTYIYGIYRSTVDYSGTPVYVDKTGHLGTEGGVLFAFRQTTTLTNATGDGTVYVFGNSSGLTIDIDNTASLSGGVGAPIIFTAPYYGKYCFTASITMSVPASPPVPRPVGVDPLYVVTSNLSYVYTNFIPASTASVQYTSEIVTTIVYLDAGDTVRWACAAGTGATAKNISIVNYLAPTIPGVGVTTCYATYFTGYRIS
jgi:hypothetical protein